MTQTSAMKTRSQIKYENSGIYEADIDFDGASEAWKENKKSSGNGCYKYRCIAFVAKTGIKCEKFSKSGCDYCAMHNKK